MSTTWVITTARTYIELDSVRPSQITFIVTNPSSRTDRVAFDVLALDGADPSWFRVDEPQRTLAPGSSVSYPVLVAVPPTATPGTYWIQARVTSAGAAPGAGSELSSQVALVVEPEVNPPTLSLPVSVPPAPPETPAAGLTANRRELPAGAILIAALVALMLLVIGVLAFGGVAVS